MAQYCGGDRWHPRHFWGSRLLQRFRSATLEWFLVGLLYGMQHVLLRADPQSGRAVLGPQPRAAVDLLAHAAVCLPGVFFVDARLLPHPRRAALVGSASVAACAQGAPAVGVSAANLHHSRL
eukprot:4147301-Prymnesium_polylepis.1